VSVAGEKVMRGLKQAKLYEHERLYKARRDAADELYEALVALTKAVNTNELAAAMACHEIVAFANVEDALKLALPAIRKARGEHD
jgi:hypothetical protein